MDQQCPRCGNWIVWSVAPGGRWVPADRNSFIDCGLSLECDGEYGPPFRTGLGHVDHRDHCGWKVLRPPLREPKHYDTADYAQEPRKRTSQRPGADASARNASARNASARSNDPNGILAEAPMRELGLLPSAHPAVVKAAYRALVLLRHPDRGGSEEEMKRLNAAYLKLQKLGRAPK